MADVLDGLFDIIDGVIRLVEGPEFSSKVLSAINSAAYNVVSGRMQARAAARDLAKVSPAAAIAFQGWCDRGINLMVLLVMLLTLIQDYRENKGNEPLQERMVAAWEGIAESLDQPIIRENRVPPSTGLSYPLPPSTLSRDPHGYHALNEILNKSSNHNPDMKNRKTRRAEASKRRSNVSE